MKSYSQEHELMRRRIWIGAWTSVASATDCKAPKIATNWADNALKDFDERFKPMTDNVQQES